MAELIIRIVFDLLLLAALVVAIIYALRVEKQLAIIRQSRAEMEKFITDFSLTVSRAEAGIKGLKLVAREAGDDLEKLIDRASLMKEELQEVHAQADRLAERITNETLKLRQQAPAGAPMAAPISPRLVERTEASAAPTTAPLTQPAPPPTQANAEASTTPPANVSNVVPRSRAEAELLRVIEKLR